MHQIHRRVYKAIQDDRPQYGGTFIVYDGKEDAISHNVTPKFWKDPSIEIGDWIEYPDGKVSECCRVCIRKTKGTHGKIITTRLNCFSQNQKTVVSDLLPYRAPTSRAQPDTITPSRIEFAEEWLLNGSSIEKACAKHLWSGSGTRKVTSRSYKTYAYLVLSLPWFDRLLKENRLIRDRYMTLVGALNIAGVDEVYIAQQLKSDIESANPKLHINAINNAIELLEAYAQKKRIPIEASWKIESTQPKQLTEPENTDINSILKDTLHERIRSESSEAQRIETVSFVSEDQRSVGGMHEASRDTPVSTGTSNETRLQQSEQVVSPDKV